jgi:hypothetical protein
MTDNLSRAVSPFFFAPGPLFGLKNTQNPHILAHVNKERPNDGYLKLKICIWYLIIDSYRYTPAAYVTLHCMI